MSWSYKKISRSFLYLPSFKCIYCLYSHSCTLFNSLMERYSIFRFLFVVIRYMFTMRISKWAMAASKQESNSVKRCFIFIASLRHNGIVISALIIPVISFFYPRYKKAYSNNCHIINCPIWDEPVSILRYSKHK